MKNKKSQNFFKVPHKLEEHYGCKIRPSEKYFLVILLKLENRFADKEGWFWHADKKFLTQDKKYTMGFEMYGFSPSSCKRIRKRLRALDLIEIRYGWNKIGFRIGTYYHIKHEKLNKNPELKMNPP